VSRPHPALDVDDAIQYIVRYIRERVLPAGGRVESSYGYDLYLRNVIAFYLTETGGVPPGTSPWDATHTAAPVISPMFATAAWSLCRRGFLRPGIRDLRGQATDEGGSGFGFALLPAGREWIVSGATADYVPLEPGRFARMLSERGARFGPGFIERSQEAVRAYNALAYLACCAMCGAAAESIVLTLAIAKRGDAAKVMKDYEGSGGRRRVEQSLISSQPPHAQEEFHRYVGLLKHWRDSAAHGKAANITELEAWTSLLLLLRFAIFASDRWQELTGTP
jgi:hypothetical protein